MKKCDLTEFFAYCLKRQGYDEKTYDDKKMISKTNST